MDVSDNVFFDYRTYKMLSRTSRKKIKAWITKQAESPLLDILRTELNGCKRVLDIGCGVGSPIGKIRKNFFLEGIDALPKSKVPTFYDKYKQGNIKELTKYYKEKSFDAAIVLDVIEHLKKKDGLKLIKDLEKIVKKKIIILTPSGFMYQGPVGGNIYQIHLSGWKAKEFQEKGFKTSGLHGFKFLRGDLAAIKYKPWYVWLYISHLTQYITRYFPGIAFHVIAIKKMGEKE